MTNDKKIFLVPENKFSQHPEQSTLAVIGWSTLNEHIITPDADGFIKFELVMKKPKTEVWELQTKEGDILGIIQWYPAWRHYVFAPNEETVYSDRCQLAIGLKIIELNEEHKKNWRKLK